MSFKNEEYFLNGLKKLGFLVKPEHIKLFEIYYNHVIEWNEKINLTRITDEKDFLEKHFLDSLSVIRSLDKSKLKKDIKAIDIGTGAGFPLLPLWIFYPDWEITLLDTVKKKITFLESLKEEFLKEFPDLKAQNIQLIHSRAEVLSNNNKYREKYDYVFTRAVSRLQVLSELSLGFPKKSGLFIAMKGFEIEHELAEAEKAINFMGGNVINIDKFELLDTGYKRSIVTIRKMKKTPEKYPRKESFIKKSPII